MGKWFGGVHVGRDVLAGRKTDQWIADDVGGDAPRVEFPRHRLGINHRGRHEERLIRGGEGDFGAGQLEDAGQVRQPASQSRPIQVGFQPALVQSGAGPAVLADLFEVLRLQGAEVIAAAGQKPVFGADDPERLAAGQFPLPAGEVAPPETLARRADDLGQSGLPGLRALVVQAQRHDEIERPVRTRRPRPRTISADRRSSSNGRRAAAALVIGGREE